MTFWAGVAVGLGLGFFGTVGLGAIIAGRWLQREEEQERLATYGREPVDEFDRLLHFAPQGARDLPSAIEPIRHRKGTPR